MVTSSDVNVTVTGCEPVSDKEAAPTVSAGSVLNVTPSFEFADERLEAVALTLRSLGVSAPMKSLRPGMNPKYPRTRAAMITDTRSPVRSLLSKARAPCGYEDLDAIGLYSLSVRTSFLNRELQ